MEYSLAFVVALPGIHLILSFIAFFTNLIPRMLTAFFTANMHIIKSKIIESEVGKIGYNFLLISSTAVFTGSSFINILLGAFICYLSMSFSSSLNIDTLFVKIHQKVSNQLELGQILTNTQAGYRNIDILSIVVYFVFVLFNWVPFRGFWDSFRKILGEALNSKVLLVIFLIVSLIWGVFLLWKLFRTTAINDK